MVALSITLETSLKTCFFKRRLTATEGLADWGPKSGSISARTKTFVTKQHSSSITESLFSLSDCNKTVVKENF
jgi:hypothetical protein